MYYYDEGRKVRQDETYLKYISLQSTTPSGTIYLASKLERQKYEKEKVARDVNIVQLKLKTGLFYIAPVGNHSCSCWSYQLLYAEVF